VAETSPPDFEAKICGLQALASCAAALPRPMVFTNGVFDILHRGHVTYLAQARALGASLVVGVNSDASVKRLDKGAERPVNELGDRMAVLAALASVSLVTCFDEDTPLALILACRPDVLVKGGDYTPDTVVGRDLVESYGGEIVICPRIDGLSTTDLVRKIRERDR
jgi:rfaE bifunctional protein nucleotidyltransferase chain/domain